MPVNKSSRLHVKMFLIMIFVLVHRPTYWSKQTFMILYDDAMMNKTFTFLICAVSQSHHHTTAQ